MDLSELNIDPIATMDLLQLTKTDAIYAILRESIITGRLKPGDRIRQQDLANTLNVSATPVREALHKFDALGILTHVRHHGAQVATPNRQAIDEIFRVRAILEGVAIQESVKHLDQDLLDRLENLARFKMPASLEQGYVDEDFLPYRKANYEFHKIICLSSKMEVIPELIDNLWARSVVPVEVFLFDCIRVRNAYKEHISILEALAKKNGEEARELLETHVDLTRKCYLRFIDHVSEKEIQAAPVLGS